MSVEAPWIAVAIDWMESDMFDGATPGHRLAWVCLLCHVKAHGRAGRAKMRRRSFQRKYELSDRAVNDMIEAAQKCGAVTIDGDTVTLCNWSNYQHASQKKTRPKVGKVPKRGESSENSATGTGTDHTSPSTHHQAPSTKHRTIDRSDEIDRDRVKVFDAAERLLARPLKRHEIDALAQYLDLLDERVEVGGEQVASVVLVDRAIAESVGRCGSRTMTGLLRYVGAIVDRCIREAVWPGDFDDDDSRGKTTATSGNAKGQPSAAARRRAEQAEREFAESIDVPEL